MTQTQAILSRLQRGGILTPLDALNDPDIRAMRLSERIRELQKVGYEIEHIPFKTPTGKNVMSYRLKKKVLTYLPGII